jgi:hypothetical protein
MPPLPPSWTTNVSNFYYVRQGGANSGNGFPGNPRGSIPNPIPAGAVVVIDRTVTFQMPSSITFAGTSSNPAFLVGSGLSTAARSRMDGTDRSINGTYGVIEYIHFHAPSNGPCIWVGNGTVDHLSLRHCEGTGVLNATNAFGVLAGGSRNTVIFYDCTFHDNGDWQYSGSADVDAQGFQIQSNTQNVWFVDSTFSHLAGQAVTGGNQEAGGVDTTEHHVYCGRNLAFQNLAGGFAFKGATDHIMSQNTCWGMRSNPVSGAGPSQGLGTQYNIRRYWYLFNLVYDCRDDGIEIFETGSTLEDVYIIGNVIHSMDNFGIYIQRTPSSGNPIGIANNTIVNCRVGIESRGQNNAWENNIVDNVSLHYEDQGSSGNSVFRNNLFGPGVQNFRVTYGGTTYTSLATWQNATGGRATNNVNVDPIYADGTNATIASRNFALLPGSRGINEGNATEPACYGRFETLYGIDIRRDFNRIGRPQGGTWDIGAFEFGGGGTGPNPPGSLQLGRSTRPRPPSADRDREENA